MSSPLYNIKIASPCSANWDTMYGNERKRFCGDCKLNVYNISGMTLKEAESLLERSEGRLCMRYFRRADGTILTKDCPVGWAKVKQQASMIATAAFSLIAGLFSGLLAMSFFGRETRPSEPYGYELMGAIAANDSRSSRTMEEMIGVRGNVALPKKRPN